MTEIYTTTNEQMMSSQQARLLRVTPRAAALTIAVDPALTDSFHVGWTGAAPRVARDLRVDETELGSIGGIVRQRTADADAGTDEVTLRVLGGASGLTVGAHDG
jgi:hypothetical protein